MRCKRRASNLTGAAKAMAEYDSWIGRGRRMMIDFHLKCSDVSGMTIMPRFKACAKSSS